MCRECTAAAANNEAPSPGFSDRSMVSAPASPQTYSAQTYSTQTFLPQTCSTQTYSPQTYSRRPYVPTSVVDGAAMQKLQMLSVFLHAHTPKLQHRRVGDAINLSYFARIPSMDLSSPLLSSAVDSLSFAHLGRNMNDAGLVELSRHRYGEALSSLTKMIDSSEMTIQNRREIVTAIVLISLYDESMPTAHKATNTWETHYNGVQKYLEMAGPAVFARRDRDDVLLLGNLLPPLYILGLAKRKAVVFSKPEWQSTLTLTVVLRQFYPFMLSLPSMLERVDADMGDSNADLAPLCNEFDRAYAAGDKWFKTNLPGVLPGTVHVSDALAFNPDIEEHCFVTGSTTFTQFWLFDHPTQATRACLVWISQLLAECALLRMMLADPARLGFLKHSGRDTEAVIANAHLLAGNLCQAVHYLSGLASMAFADLIVVMLGVGLTFYAESGSFTELEWCEGCIGATLQRKVRLEAIMPRTLCRLAQLGSKLAAGAKYRPRKLRMSYSNHSANQSPVIETVLPLHTMNNYHNLTMA